MTGYYTPDKVHPKKKWLIIKQMRLGLDLISLCRDPIFNNEYVLFIEDKNIDDCIPIDFYFSCKTQAHAIRMFLREVYYFGVKYLNRSNK